MASVFSAIIEGVLPGHFVWSDDRCVAILSISPTTAGHTLVVPREEIDHWTDAPPDLLAHLTRVAQSVGSAQKSAFGGERIALAIAGFDVPHLHLHVFATSGPGDFARLGGTAASEQDLAQAARALRSALVELGHDQPVREALLASAR